MHLISYDIQEDALRVKIAKTLIRYGMYRIQYSVFMGDIKDSALKKITDALHQFAQEALWSADDSVMVLPLHQYSEDYVEFIGRSPEEWLEITGKMHTLIL
mgnify:CR=1 FL=1